MKIRLKQEFKNVCAFQRMNPQNKKMKEENKRKKKYECAFVIWDSFIHVTCIKESHMTNAHSYCCFIPVSSHMGFFYTCYM